MFNYDNIGKKIKGLAKVIFWIEAIAAIIGGLAILFGFEDGWWGILIILCGSVAAWVSSWLLYGFGEIIDKLCDIAHNTGMVCKPAEFNEARAQYEATARAKHQVEEKAKRQTEELLKQEAEKRAKRQAEERAEREAIKRAMKEMEENQVAVVCPKCSEELFFQKDSQNVECPYCGCKINMTK